MAVKSKPTNPETGSYAGPPIESGLTRDNRKGDTMIEAMFWLTILGLAYWLMRETNWLRIRLLVGEFPEPDTTVRKSWTELTEINHIPHKYQPFWMKYPTLMQPLCGWDWLQNTMHVIPEYKVVLISAHYKSTMTVKACEGAASVLRDAFRVNRNPYLKVRVLDHPRDWKDNPLTVEVL